MAAQPTDDSKGSKQDIARGGLVLVMDDDEMVRRVAGSMIERLGYETTLTSHGGEALDRARQLAAEGSVLSAALLDLTVRSGEGGRDIVGRLGELWPGLPIIACSGRSDDPVMTTPTAFGFSDRLHKPFLMSELKELLSRAIVAR